MENQQSISSDLIRGHIDTIILHSLLDGDKFAQQITDYVDIKSDGEYKINQATLYSCLKRLESSKLVESYWHDYEDGRRKFFKISDSGKKAVDANLSSWTYSRMIIDKLMNLSYTPVYRVVNNNKVVENQVASEIKNSEETNKIQDRTFISESVKEETKVADFERNLKENQKTENNIINLKEQSPTTFSDTEVTEESRERNFRNILNGLLQLSVKERNVSEEKLTPITDNIYENDQEESEVSSSKVQKFSETLDERRYGAVSSDLSDKSNFTDLQEKAKNEGFIIRISSKDSAKPSGSLLINKLNFSSALITFSLAVLETLIIALFAGNSFSSPSVVILSLLNIIPLSFFAVKYFSLRHKTTIDEVSPDGILTSSIVAFNVILILFAIIFIFDIDLSNTVLLLSVLILPILLALNTVMFFIFRFLLRKKNGFMRK